METRFSIDGTDEEKYFLIERTPNIASIEFEKSRFYEPPCCAEGAGALGKRLPGNDEMRTHPFRDGSHGGGVSCLLASFMLCLQ